MVLGFSDDIQEVVMKYYKDYEERIISIDTILEDVHTWAKENKVEEIKSKIINNYLKAFVK